MRNELQNAGFPGAFPSFIQSRFPALHTPIRGLLPHRIAIEVFGAHAELGGFVGKNGNPATNQAVLLVGVVYGQVGDDGVFIPIERIYAESLLRGYDWTTEEVRPLPALDDPMADSLLLEPSVSGQAIVATYAEKDLSQGLGIGYQAQLYRTVGQPPPRCSTQAVARS